MNVGDYCCLINMLNRISFTLKCFKHFLSQVMHQKVDTTKRTEAC